MSSIRPRKAARVGPPIYFGYWLIGAAFVAQFVSAGMQNYVVGAFMEPMTLELGWTRAQFTIPRALAQFVLAAVGFVVGGYIDRFGGRRFMLAGATVLVAALAAHSRVHSLWAWIVLNGLVLTVGAGLIGNLVVNVTLAKWFVERRGRAVAWAAMGVSFAGIVLTPFATGVIDGWGWRVGWLALAAVTALLVYPIALLMRRAPEDHGWHPDGRSDADVAAGLTQHAADDFARSMTRGQALRTWRFYLLVVAFGLFTVNIGVMLLQTIPLMTDAGYSRATAALMITVASVPALISKPIWGYFIDKLEGRRLAAGGAALTGFAVVIIVAAVDSGTHAGAYAGYFLLGCGWGGMIPLQEVIWASFFGRRYIGAVRGAAMPFALIFGAAGPLAVSYYHDLVGNYDGALLVVAAANLASAVLLLLLPVPASRVAPAMNEDLRAKL